MKILFVHYKYDYTNRWERTKRGYHGDYHLFYLPLLEIARKRGHEVLPFWIDEVIVERGRAGMRQALLETILKEKPDVCLFYSGNEDDYIRALPDIKAKSDTATVYNGMDDSWRFDDSSRRVAPYFSWVVTLYAGGVWKYAKIGCTHLVATQVGVNTEACRPVPGPKDIDVSFVGTWSKPRGKIIRDLRGAGVNVFVRGNGWPEGGVSQDEMARIMSHSKISLSLNPPAFYFGWRPIVRLFLRRAWLGEGGSSYKLDIRNFFGNLRSWWQKKIPQIKARHFEIPAFGTMQITQDADNLKDYYTPGKEIVIYADTEDCAEKIRYYLSHPEEREAIARAGYERTVRDHTVEKRLYDMFSRIGHPL